MPRSRRPGQQRSVCANSGTTTPPNHDPIMTQEEDFMKTKQFLILVTFVALFAGCATVAPNELINARSAYRHASEGPAEQLVPAELHKAHEALVLAEQSFLKEPDSYKTKDLAYVAQRKSEQAGALGAMAADKANKDKANADFQKKQTEIVKQGKQDLSDSEKRTAAALAELAKLAAVKEEERGLVVTLSGGVLFRSAKSTLLSSAQVKLDQVAKALMAVSERNLIVEGHTDSQGSESYNQGLSQRRADAVRDYLVQRGYPGDHIQSRGMGKGSPIADNASPEGRANNRRVEIVIER
jgi:outer membrane protein OmpA-like peptidoglycan-associated protein